MQDFAINRAESNKVSWEHIIVSYSHIQGLATLYSSFKYVFFKPLALRTLNKGKYTLIGYVRGQTLSKQRSGSLTEPSPWTTGFLVTES